MMERTEEFFEFIERYLEGSLTVEEKSAFEEKMKTDIDLQEEVEKHRSLHDSLKDTDAILFRKKIQHISAELKQEDSTGNTFITPLKKFWKIAATILILVSHSVVWWGQKNDTTEDLFRSYYKAYPIEDQVRGEKTDQKLKDILKNYANEKYQEVESDLLKLVQTNPNNSIFKLYLGNCYLNTNEEVKAVELFKEIQREDSKYEAAQWYLALSYLKLHQKQKASTLLQKLVEYDGIYAQTASKLLKDLL